MSKLRTSLMIGMSRELKEAVELHAGGLNQATAEVARQALAKFVGYDLAEEASKRIETRGRPRQYADKSARREASKKRRADKRAVAKALLANYEAEDAGKMRSDMAAAVEAKAARGSK